MKEQIEGKKNAEELNSRYGSDDETAKHESKGEKVKPSKQGAHSKMHSESGGQTDNDSPIAARAGAGRRRGHGHGPGGPHGMMPGEKANDFKGSMKKLIQFMATSRLPLVWCSFSRLPQPCLTLWVLVYFLPQQRNYSRVSVRRLQVREASTFLRWEPFCSSLWVCMHSHRFARLCRAG